MENEIIKPVGMITSEARKRLVESTVKESLTVQIATPLEAPKTMVLNPITGQEHQAHPFFFSRVRGELK